jgi:hypothetical protein
MGFVIPDPIREMPTNMKLRREYLAFEVNVDFQ